MTATTALLCRVPRGRWVAVVRRGVVTRVFTSGVAWRLPFVDRFVERPEDLDGVPIHARATTRDGVPVHVLAKAAISVPRPVVGTTYADPWRAAELAAEELIARTAAGWSAADLRDSVVETTRPLRRAVDEAVDEHGVELLDLALVEVDVSLHGPD